MFIEQKIIETPSELEETTNYIDGVVVKLGIQAPPGIKFIINDGELITMNDLGVFEIDLIGGYGFITSLKFNKDKSSKAIGIHYPIIIDMIKEG